MQGDIIVELVGSATSGETWYFNDTIGEPYSSTVVVNFTSNGTEYAGIRLIKQFAVIHVMQYKHDTKYIKVYDYMKSKWLNEAYRTIVLDEPATGDFLAFLEANATKLS